MPGVLKREKTALKPQIGIMWKDSKSLFSDQNLPIVQLFGNILALVLFF